MSSQCGMWKEITFKIFDVLCSGNAQWTFKQGVNRHHSQNCKLQKADPFVDRFPDTSMKNKTIGHWKMTDGTTD